MRGANNRTEAQRLVTEQEEIGALNFDEAAWTDFGQRSARPTGDFLFREYRATTSFQRMSSLCMHKASLKKRSGSV